MSGDVEGQVKGVIWQTSLLSAAMGVVFSPVPLVDEILLMPVYGVMAARIGKARGLELGQVPWKAVFGAAAAGLAARAAVNVSFAFIPGVAAVANAISAAALTRLLGGYVDGVCRDGVAATPPFVAAV
jgi:uncharacterized protein (DUF697 family)